MPAAAFIEQGQQQVNVREVGLYRNVHDIEETLLKTSNGTALRVKDIADRAAGPERSAWARSVRPSTARTAKIIDDGDVVEGIVLLQKGDDSDSTLVGHSRQGQGAQ